MLPSISNSFPVVAVAAAPLSGTQDKVARGNMEPRVWESFETELF